MGDEAGRTLCLILSRPVAGREAEYHEWYDRQHLDDVRRVPGVTAGRRYETADPAGGYLAVYEIDGDPDHVLAELTRRFGTADMPASDALDLASINMTFWTPRPAP